MASAGPHRRVAESLAQVMVVPVPGVKMGIYLERHCAACRVTTRSLVREIRFQPLPGQSLEDAIDASLTGGTPIVPVACRRCGREEWPSHLLLVDEDRGAVAARILIGSGDTPVHTTPDAPAMPYGNMLDAAAAEEFERGVGKMAETWAAGRDAFWEAFCAEALSDWRRWSAELSPQDWVAAYAALGVEPLPSGTMAAAWRRDADRRGLDRKALWRAANQELVERNAAWLSPQQWATEEWVRQYGRERVRWVLLHVPLPEELERWRTEALHAVLPRGQSAGALWDRIGQLGEALDRQRRRAEGLAEQLRQERDRRAALEAALAGARREAAELRRQLAEAEGARPDVEQTRRIRRLRGLIADLRAEVERLAQAAGAGAAVDAPGIAESSVPASDGADAARGGGGAHGVDTAVVPTVPQGVVVAVIGRDAGAPPWARAVPEDAPRHAVFAAVSDADVVVLLTRRVPHRVLWDVREACAEAGVPLVYCAETGWQRIEHAAVRALSEGRMKQDD